MKGKKLNQIRVLTIEETELVGGGFNLKKIIEGVKKVADGIKEIWDGIVH